MNSWIKCLPKSVVLPVLPPLAKRPRAGFFAKGFARWLLQEFINESIEKNLDEKPVRLLRAMQTFYYIFSKDRQKKLEHFDGSYVFSHKSSRESEIEKKGSHPQGVDFSVRFKNKNMYVYEGVLKEWDVWFKFENSDGLRSFLFSDDEDMIKAVLEDKVRTEGNVNYLYQFGLLARHLCQKARTFVAP